MYLKIFRTIIIILCYEAPLLCNYQFKNDWKKVLFVMKTRILYSGVRKIFEGGGEGGKFSESFDQSLCRRQGCVIWWRSPQLQCKFWLLVAKILSFGEHFWLNSSTYCFKNFWKCLWFYCNYINFSKRNTILTTSLTITPLNYKRIVKNLILQWIFMLVWPIWGAMTQSHL